MVPPNSTLDRVLTNFYNSYVQLVNADRKRFQLCEIAVSYFAVCFCGFAPLREMSSRANKFTQRREDTQSQTKTLPARWWWRCLRWHAHLARGFTGGTPVPLFQTAPLP